MDPLTAGLQLGAAFLNYLTSPTGQQFAMAQNALVAKLNLQIADVFDHLHGQLMSATAPKPPAAGA